MEKVCIFCGKQVKRRAAEHVIPQWLEKLNGSPTQVGEFGYRNLGKGQFVKRRFSLNAFKFPSCEGCNQEFAKLEEDVKVIVNKMMLEDCLSESELSTLLDWFDKVRIGLWLGYLYLDRNPLGIIPGFYIQDRIRREDRMLAIFKAEGDRKELMGIGCNTYAFAQTPSCFSLRINNLWFLNVSYPYLLAKRMGFPFPMNTYMGEDGLTYCTLNRGRNRIMQPVSGKETRIKGTELYQTIFIKDIDCEDDGWIRRLYDTKYVRDNCMSWEEGIGRVFVKRDSEVSAYDTSPSMEWLPKETHDSEELDVGMRLATLEWQLYIIDDLMPSLRFISEERRKRAIKLRNYVRDYNRKLVERLNMEERY